MKQEIDENESNIERIILESREKEIAMGNNWKYLESMIEELILGSNSMQKQMDILFAEKNRLNESYKILRKSPLKVLIFYIEETRYKILQELENIK